MRNGKQQTDRLFILILFFKEEEECCGGNIVECRLIGNCARGKYTNKDIRLPSQKKDERNIGKKNYSRCNYTQNTRTVTFEGWRKGVKEAFPFFDEKNSNNNNKKKKQRRRRNSIRVESIVERWT